MTAHHHAHGSSCGCCQNTGHTERFSVPDMDCPVEAGEIRKELEKLEGAESFRADTAKRILTVSGTCSADDVLKALEKAGHPGKLLREENSDCTMTVAVPEMDCPVEAGEIRKALAALAWLPEGRYDTARRRITFSAPAERAEEVAALIREKTGFKAAAVKTESASPQHSSLVISVPGMDCPAEAAEIRQALARLSWLSEGQYDTEKREISFDASRDRAPEIIAAIRKAGFDAQMALRVQSPAQTAAGSSVPWEKLAAALAIALAAEFIPEFSDGNGALFSVFGRGFTLPELSGMLLSVLAVALAGTATLKRGLQAVLRLQANMNSLMMLAVTGAFFTGNWAEGAMVMVLFEISEAIEQLCLATNRSAVKSLLSVVPKTARVLRSGRWAEMPAESILKGDTVQVLAGERISVDGTVTNGASSADESMISGEPVPVPKTAGSSVFAGTVNQTGVLEIRATALASDTVAARIIASVEEAEQKRAPIQRFVDQFAAWYTPAVFIAAVLTAVIPPVLLSGEWLVWLYRGLVLLVIGCPCALVIGTPVTVVSALACAARQGVLIKGGVYLEQGRRLKNVALDKTGTVTEGRPELTDIIPVSFGVTEQKALKLASALTQLSDHPVSAAITRRAEEENLLAEPAENLKALPGTGISASAGGAAYRLVSSRSLAQNSAAAQRAAELESRGMSVSVLSDALGPVAVFGVSDRIKPESAEAIADLKAAGMTPWMLTGDNARAAAFIAEQAGIANVCSELKPDDKLEKISELRKDGLTAMTGDGINDAPALAAADISFSMGVKGTDTALEASSVVLMDDNLGKIAFFKRLSEKTYRFLVANIAFALLVKFGFVILDLTGFATMWMAVFADTGVTLLVVANGMRLLKAAPGIRRETAAARNSVPPVPLSAPEAAA